MLIVDVIVMENVTLAFCFTQTL